MNSEVNDVVLYFKAKQTCHVCKQQFTNGTSVGRFQCVEHAARPVDGYFPCCGVYVGSFKSMTDFYEDRLVDRRARGCISADHCARGRGGEYRPHCWARTSVEIVKTVASRIGCLPESISEIEGDSNYVVVHSYDRAAFKAYLDSAKPDMFR